MIEFDVPQKVRRTGAAAVMAGTALGITGCSVGNDDPMRYELPDTSVTAVFIHEGANLRADPYVGEPDGDFNLLGSLELPIIVSDRNGIRIEREYHNGDWYGVEASAITESAKAQGIKPEDIPELEYDADGIVWVNKVKAELWNLNPVDKEAL